MTLKSAADRPAPPLRLAGRALKQNRHVCAFFHSQEERNKILMPFFIDGLKRGEKVVNFVDARQHDDHVCAYRQSGIDVDAAQENGQLEIRHWEDAYLKDGYFDGDRMIRMLEATLQENRDQYGLTRVTGQMEWALETLPGVTDIVEYETKLNYVVERHPDPTICVYDLNKHSGSVVMDILRTHPMVIVGGVLQENPLYVPPDEFLKELHDRKASQPAGQIGAEASN